MKLQKIMNRIQFLLGFAVIIFAISIFINIHNYMLAPLEDQLYVIWNTLFLILILYGSFQTMSGAVAVYLENIKTEE